MNMKSINREIEKNGVRKNKNISVILQIEKETLITLTFDPT